MKARRLRALAEIVATAAMLAFGFAGLLAWVGLLAGWLGPTHQ